MSKPEQAADGAPPAEVSKPPSGAKLDPTYYTWRNTFSIMLSRMTGDRDINLEQKYFEEQDVLKEDAFCRRCEKQRDHLLQYSMLYYPGVCSMPQY